MADAVPSPQTAAIGASNGDAKTDAAAAPPNASVATTPPSATLDPPAAQTPTPVPQQTPAQSPDLVPPEPATTHPAETPSVPVETVSGQNSAPEHAVPEQDSSPTPPLAVQHAEHTEQSQSVPEESASLPLEEEEIYAQAGWNYSAQEDNEISFAVGDIVRVYLRANVDWWEGTNLSKPQPSPVGYFPANRVKLLSSKPALKEAAETTSASTTDVASLTTVVPEVSSSISPAAAAAVAVITDLAAEATQSTSPSSTTKDANEQIEGPVQTVPELVESVAEHAPAVSLDDVGTTAENEASGQDEAVVVSVEVAPANQDAVGPETADSDELLDTEGNPLPENWRKLWQAEEQSFYYFNMVTEETSWDIPGKASAEQQEAQREPEAEESAVAVDDPALTAINANLPPHWEAVRDEKGDIYYYNDETEQTSWEAPIGDTSPQTPPVLPPSSSKEDRRSPTFFTFDKLPPQLLLIAGLMFLRVEDGDDKRINKDWTQYWVALSRGMLVIFGATPANQPKPFVACIDLTNLQWRPATKDETKKKMAFFLETAAKQAYLLRTEDEAEYPKWMQALGAACQPANAEEADLAAELRQFSAFLESQSDPTNAKKESKSSWKSMGGLLAGLGGKSASLPDTSPPNVRKALPEQQPPPAQPAPPYACFGGRLIDQVAKQQRQIPFIVEMCIKQVEAQGLESEGIYRLSGNAANVQRLKATFSAQDCPTLSPEEASDVNSLASLLKLYFRELENPLIPYEAYEEFMGVIRLSSRDDRLSKLKDLVQALAVSMRPHHDVLEYLMQHLHRVQDHSDVNKMEPANLAIVFGPTIFRSPGEQAGNLQIMNIPIQNELVELMVETAGWIFDGSTS